MWLALGFLVAINSSTLGGGDNGTTKKSLLTDNGAPFWKEEFPADDLPSHQEAAKIPMMRPKVEIFLSK